MEQIYPDEAAELLRMIQRRQAKGRMSDLNIALAPWASQKFREELFAFYQDQVYLHPGPAKQLEPEKLERAKLSGLKVLIGGRRGSDT